MFNKSKIKSVHMIGIGGMGMSSLAFFLKLNNIEVSGSDIGQEQAPLLKVFISRYQQSMFRLKNHLATINY